MENRKNPETRAKSSTWCERMAAPILRGRNLVSGGMAGKDGERVNLQALNHTKWTQTKVGTKHREEPVEKCHRPPYLREDEGNDLEDDQEQVENGPKLASGFVGDRAEAERRR
jgi:hypothetical protein